MIRRYLLVHDTCFVQWQIRNLVCCSLRLAPAMIIITLVALLAIAQYYLADFVLENLKLKHVLLLGTGWRKKHGSMMKVLCVRLKHYKQNCRSHMGVFFQRTNKFQQHVLITIISTVTLTLSDSSNKIQKQTKTTSTLVPWSTHCSHCHSSNYGSQKQAQEIAVSRYNCEVIFGESMKHYHHLT